MDPTPSVQDHQDGIETREPQNIHLQEKISIPIAGRSDRALYWGGEPNKPLAAGENIISNDGNDDDYIAGENDIHLFLREQKLSFWSCGELSDQFLLGWNLQHSD